MRLNTLTPAAGSRTVGRRVGRGIGSGLGKTSGRGHKGQTSRTGGKIRPGFEGGQQPLYRRLPKFGFVSLKALDRAEVRTSELNKLEDSVATIEALKAANIISGNVKTVKVMLSGDITKAITLKGIKATVGARKAIEAAGGKIEE